jgi:hypothetical protein
MSETQPEKKPIGAPEHLDMLSKHYMRQANILRAFPIRRLPDRLGTAATLFESTVGGAYAIHTLAKNGYTTDVYVVLRALLERVVTLFYLMAASEDEFNAYIQYSIQKTYRHIDRSLTIGQKTMSVKFSGKINLDEHPTLKEAVSRFTSERGRPKTRWSNTSIEEKLRIVEASKIVSTDSLMFNILSFYDDCSEASHATLYGCTFHTGLFEPGGFHKYAETAAQQQSHMDHLALVYFLGSMMLYDLNAYLCRESGLNDLLETATKANQEFLAEAPIIVGEKPKHGPIS